MLPVTNLQMVTWILQTIGVIRADEVPNANDAQAVMDTLNVIKDSWGSEGLMVYASTREAFPLTIGKQSYLWGVVPSYFQAPYYDPQYFAGQTGDFPTQRPERILGAFLTDINGNRYPISIESQETYDAVTNPDNQGLPYMIYYDPTWPLSTVYVYYTAGDNYTLNIDSEKELPDFVNLTDTVNYPAQFRKVLKYQGALEACGPFERTPSALVVKEAAEGKLVVKRIKASNLCKPVRNPLFPTPSLGFYRRTIDIRSGGF